MVGKVLVTAIHDAITLVNLLYALPSNISIKITSHFEEYCNERYPTAVEYFKNNQLMSKIMDRGIMGSLFFTSIYPHALLVVEDDACQVPHVQTATGFLKAIEIKSTIIPEVKAKGAFDKQHLHAVSV
ncbi:MAG: hypothetical protein J3R72DRAFT_425792 [Linnemannia gamsii]|nr:MAG: hypothetical protein J3R72DRAFT_425792 [Linnemannia gamsii]